MVVRADAPDEPEQLKPMGICDVWIAKPDKRYSHFKYRDLELMFDKSYYSVGDTARLLITAERADAYILLSMESENLLDSRIVFIPRGSRLLEIPITKSCVPNFHVSAYMIGQGDLFTEFRQVIVPPRWNGFLRWTSRRRAANSRPVREQPRRWRSPTMRVCRVRLKWPSWPSIRARITFSQSSARQLRSTSMGSSRHSNVSTDYSLREYLTSWGVPTFASGRGGQMKSANAGRGYLEDEVAESTAFGH